MCTLKVYKPTVQPVASRRLFFDLQVVTLLLVEFTCLHVQISTTPLPGYVYICMYTHVSVLQILLKIWT